MQNLASHTDCMIVAFAVDRAASNFPVLDWVFSQLESPAMPQNVFPFVELCAAHGVALVKGSVKVPDSLVGPSHTFSVVMRQERFVRELRNSIEFVVRTSLRVQRRPMPTASLRASDI